MGFATHIPGMAEQAELRLSPLCPPQTPVLGCCHGGTWPETSTSAPSSSSLRTVAGPVVLGTTTVAGTPSFLAAYAAARPALPPVESGGQAGLDPPHTPHLLSIPP